MSLLNNDRLRLFFSGRRRFQLAWIFAILLIISAKQYPTLPGVLICFLGATLRFIASGFLRKEAKLSVGGPYSYTRNPLYLGTLIMGIGATISVGAFILAVVIALVFFVNYNYVIDHEEAKLPSYFGEAYHRYCRLVPRFLPRLTEPPHEELLKVNPDEETYCFSMPLAKKNKAFEAYFTFVGLILGMGLLVWAKTQFGMEIH